MILSMTPNLWLKFLMNISQELRLTSDLTIPFLMTMVKMRFWYLLIAKYDNHPSILAIQSAVLEHGIFEFEQVDINQIYQILVNMNDKKATGYDGIPCKLLKLGAFPLAEILCKLSNISISECKFPDVLKLAEISALFKKIDRLCKDNYRPVSIFTALSKVFERCHSNQLLFYFEKLFSKFYLGLEKVTAVKVHC